MKLSTRYNPYDADPRLTEEEEACVLEFINEVPDALPFIAVKCLMARKFDVARAVKLYHNYVGTIRKNGFQGVRLRDVLPQLKKKKMYIPGSRDMEDCTIFVLNVNDSLPGQDKSEEILKLAFYLSEVALASMRTQRRGITILTNMENLSWANYDRDFQNTVLEFFQNNVPGMVKKILIYKSPWWMNMILNVSFPFMKDKLRKRIFLVDDLKDHIYEDQIPLEFGGTWDYDHESWIIHQLEYEGKKLQKSDDRQKRIAKKPEIKPLILNSSENPLDRARYEENSPGRSSGGTPDSVERGERSERRRQIEERRRRRRQEIEERFNQQQSSRDPNQPSSSSLSRSRSAGDRLADDGRRQERSRNPSHGSDGERDGRSRSRDESREIGLRRPADSREGRSRNLESDREERSKHRSEERDERLKHRSEEREERSRPRESDRDERSRPRRDERSRTRERDRDERSRIKENDKEERSRHRSDDSREDRPRSRGQDKLDDRKEARRDAIEAGNGNIRKSKEGSSSREKDISDKRAETRDGKGSSPSAASLDRKQMERSGREDEPNEEDIRRIKEERLRRRQEAEEERRRLKEEEEKSKAILEEQRARADVLKQREEMRRREERERDERENLQRMEDERRAKEKKRILEEQLERERLEKEQSEIELEEIARLEKERSIAEKKEREQREIARLEAKKRRKEREQQELQRQENEKAELERKLDEESRELERHERDREERLRERSSRKNSKQALDDIQNSPFAGIFRPLVNQQQEQKRGEEERDKDEWDDLESMAKSSLLTTPKRSLDDDKVPSPSSFDTLRIDLEQRRQDRRRLVRDLDEIIKDDDDDSVDGNDDGYGGKGKEKIDLQEHRKKLDDMEEIMRQRYADMQTKREKLKQRRESIRLVNTEAKDTKDILNSIISRSNISDAAAGKLSRGNVPDPIVTNREAMTRGESKDEWLRRREEKRNEEKSRGHPRDRRGGGDVGLESSERERAGRDRADRGDNERRERRERRERDAEDGQRRGRDPGEERSGKSRGDDSREELKSRDRDVLQKKERGSSGSRSNLSARERLEERQRRRQGQDIQKIRQ